MVFGTMALQNSAFAWCSARNIGSLPADDQPPNVRVTITCKPTSAARVTHAAALCSGESKPAGICWMSSTIRKISGPLHQECDNSSCADRPGGGSRLASRADMSFIIACTPSRLYAKFSTYSDPSTVSS